MNYSRKLKRTPLPRLATALTLAFGVLAPMALQAQEEIFELSPFIVDAASDDGYRATETLSGGRLKTDLDNVAAQVEVLTEEFLDDWALDNVQDALVYTANVENGEEFTDANNARFSTGSGNYARIRGLGDASNATGNRNFFNTRSRMEGYNTDRVEIVSGPNAILFGLGNAGGMLSTQLKRAYFRDGNEINLRADSEGSFTVEGDFNKVLIDKVLAIRVGVLHRDDETSRKPNSFKDDRFYMTSTLKPFAAFDYDKTTIRVHYEAIDIRNAKAPNKVVFDQASPYLDLAGGNAFDNTGTRAGNRTNFANPLPEYLADDRNRVTYYVAPAGNDSEISVIDGTFGWAEVRTPDSVASYGVNALDRFRYSLPLEYASFYPTDRNWEGDTFMQKHENEIVSVFLEHQFSKNLFLELAYNKEEVIQDTVSYFRGGDFRIYVDANKFLPLSDTPNPNFGKPYFEGVPNEALQEWGEEEFRGSLSYEFDFTDHSESRFARWLGRHSVGLLYQDRESRSEAEDYFAKVVTPNLSFLPSNAQESNGGPWAVRAERGFAFRQYIDAENPVVNAFGNFFEPVDLVHPATGETFTVALDDGYGPQRAPLGERIGIESTTLNWMGRFFEDNLILSYGVRDDSLKLKDYASDEATKLANGAWVPFRDRTFGDWGASQSGTTKAKSVIFKPLGFFGNQSSPLTLYWYESDTFNPQISDLNPLNGDRLPGNFGTGQDYGLRLSLLAKNNARLSFEVNVFENADNGVSLSSAFDAAKNGFVNFERAVNRTYNEFFGEGAYSALPQNQDIPIFVDFNANQYGVVGDTVAEGVEYSLVFDNGGFTFRLSGAKTETVVTNVAKNWNKWVSLRQPVWSALSFDDSGTGWESAVDPDSGETIKSLYDSIVVAQGTEFYKASDGQAVQSLPDWRLNASGRYKFNDGKMKGVSLGLSVRYRGAAAIGYRSKLINAGTPDEIEVSDLTSPIDGNDSMIFDTFISYSPEKGKGLFGFAGEKLRVTYQLNVRNLFESNTIQAIRADSNGTARVFKYNEPRLFIASAKLRF